MMYRLLITVWVFATLASGIQAQNASLNPYESDERVTPANQIDKAVLPRLNRLGVKPRLCSDAVFVRRAYLDVTGTLPTAEEARRFIEKADKNKRSLLIDELIESPAFADCWAMKWGDILRIKAEFPVNLWPNAAQAYHRWVKASIAENKPYDQFARELLTSSGSNFRVGPVNFYRAVQNRTPEGIASAVALTFMGSRTDAWPKDQLEGMSAFFAQVGYKPTREWKEETVYWDPFGSIAKGTNIVEASEAVPSVHAPSVARLPGGKPFKLPADRDPRELFADWLVKPENPYFTKAIANRVWSWFFGRGIIHEPDDIRKDNPPSNPVLLACLEKELVQGKYDLRRLFRLILNSRVYQLASARPAEKDLEGQFAYYPVRRLDAEVLIDAINSITGTSDLYTSAIPEPFTYIPQDQPSIAIADGSITSPFLTLFGRSARATGMESERSNKMMPSQALHLLNSSHIQRKIEQGPKLRQLLDSKRKPAELAQELYLAVLSRFPTEEELKIVQTYGTPAKNGAIYKSKDEWNDLAWALINSSEFLHRH
jgi:hypothetical protein